jgi:hypothetical protein
MMKSDPASGGAVRFTGGSLGSQQSVGANVAGTSTRESSPAVARVANRGGNARDQFSARARKTSAARCSKGDHGTVIESDDGAVSFALKAAGGRLFIERTHRSEAGTMAVQCLLIGGQEEFRRWCEMEPTRFEHPVVFDRLWRYGDEVLGRRD